MKHKKCMNLGWLFWDNTCISPESVQGLKDFYVYICFFYRLPIRSSFYILGINTWFNCMVCMQEKCASMAGQAEDTRDELNSKKTNLLTGFSKHAFTMTIFLTSKLFSTVARSELQPSTTRDAKIQRLGKQCMYAHVASWCTLCALWSTVWECVEVTDHVYIARYHYDRGLNGRYFHAFSDEDAMKWAKMIARKAPRVHLEKAVLRAANLRLSMLRWRTRSLNEQVERRR